MEIERTLPLASASNALWSGISERVGHLALLLDRLVAVVAVQGSLIDLLLLDHLAELLPFRFVRLQIHPALIWVQQLGALLVQFAEGCRSPVILIDRGYVSFGAARGHRRGL